jgi:hypothetical protein
MIDPGKLKDLYVIIVKSEIKANIDEKPVASFSSQ